MRSTRRQISATGRLVGVLTALALLGLAACREPLEPPIGAAHPGETTPRRGGKLRLASIGDLRGALDPATSAEALGRGAIEIMFAGLVDYDEAAHVVPDLASRWELSDDGLSYRFFLSEGARFHDGEEVTADDVRRSIERALHPSTPNPWASLYDMIAGYDEYTQKGAAHLAGVVVEGRYVVSIHLHDKDARFLPVLALPTLRPVCKSAGERYSDSWAPCGAGPFRLEAGGWDHGRSLTLVRHEGYFRPGLPYLDAVQWTYGMNMMTERFKLEAGDLDIVRDISQADVVRFQTDQRWNPLSVFEPVRSIYGESMNTEMPPFDNVEVRRAVAAAINREHYREVRPSAVTISNQAIPPAVPGYDPTFRGQEYDYPAALEHMRKAGYPYDPATGRGGYPGEITYYAYRPGLQEYTAQLLQQDLAKIGLQLTIKLVSFPTFVALAYRRKTTQISNPGWTEDYPDPSDFFDPLFDSSAINEEQSQNSAFYRNPRLDEILARARHELDETRRFALYGEANRIVCDDAPWAFTHNYRFYIVHQGYVRDYRAHPVWPENVGKTWLDRAADAVSSTSPGAAASWASLTGALSRPSGRRASH